MRAILMIFLGLTFLAACNLPDSDTNVETNARQVTWDEAVSILYAGDVVSVFQTHDLQVRLTLKDGTTVVATEPAIDEIVREVNRCAGCGDIAIATE